MSDIDKAKAGYVSYRREKFQVKMRRANKDSWQDWVLEITSNGEQWTSIGLMDDEIDRVIQALERAKVRK